MADIFISHSEADRDLVGRLAALLEAQGWSVWWIQSFEPLKRWQWKDVVEREIAAARCVVAVWTPQSLDSEWVGDEAAQGISRGILVPVAAGVEPPSAFRQLQTANLSDWDGTSRTAEVERFLNGVRQTLDGSSAPAGLHQKRAAEQLSAIPAKQPRRTAPPRAEAGALAEAARPSLAPGSRASPRTPKDALEIEAGRLAYQIPERMWVGVQETVEVRLGALDASELMQGFVGRGDVKDVQVPIVETMSVSLVCDPATFDIEPRSQEVQLVKPDLVKGTAFHQTDFAKWIWLVTPRQRGKHTLLVRVSAALKDSRGLPTTSSLPDKIIPVTVQVDFVRTTTVALRRAAPGLAWAVVTALVGVFTRDYWWPAVRPWLGM